MRPWRTENLKLGNFGVDLTQLSTRIVQYVQY
jgi:hypothetical protein